MPPKGRPIPGPGAGRADLVGEEGCDATKDRWRELNPTPEVKEAIAKPRDQTEERSQATGPALAGEHPEGVLGRRSPSCSGHSSGPAGKPADPALKKQVADFATDFRVRDLRAQQSPMLTFTAVSLRGNLDDASREARPG